MPLIFSKNRKNAPLFELDRVLPPASYPGGLSSFPAFPCPLRACGEWPQLPAPALALSQFLNFFNVLIVMSVTLFHKARKRFPPSSPAYHEFPCPSAPRFPPSPKFPAWGRHAFPLKEDAFPAVVLRLPSFQCAYRVFPPHSSLPLKEVSLVKGWAAFLPCSLALFCSSFLEMVLTLKSNFITCLSCASAHFFFSVLIK